MEIRSAPGSWKAVLENGLWKIKSEDGHSVATIEHGEEEVNHARLIAGSPYLFEALKGIVELIGDEDLEDNGELSGAAICDMARAAVKLVTSISEV